MREFAVRIQQQASKCNFQEHLDVALRDRLVAGINRPELQRRLLSEQNTSFPNLRVVCETTEDLNNSTQEPALLLHQSCATPYRTVTIFTQEKSTSCAIKTENVFFRMYTFKQKCPNQLLQYTPHSPAIIIVSPGQASQIVWVPPHMHWDPVSSTLASRCERLRRSSYPGYRLRAPGRSGHLQRSSGSSGPQRPSQVLENFE